MPQYVNAVVLDLRTAGSPPDPPQHLPSHQPRAILIREDAWTPEMPVLTKRRRQADGQAGHTATVHPSA